MNRDNHPDVYKNEGDLKEPNQSYYEYSPFTEMVNEQRKINDSLYRSFQELSQIYMNENHTHAAQWDEVNHHLFQLNSGNKQRQQFENHLMNQLAVLQEKDQQVKQILENESVIKQELINRINEISQTNQNIFHQLAQHESFEKQQTDQMSVMKDDQKQLIEQLTKQALNQEQISDQLMKQVDYQEQMKSQMTKQTDYQEEVLSRLEKQEALIEKALRQLQHFRSIIYERSSYLAEKIEESYDLTSAYIYNYLTSSDQPLTLYLANQKQKQSEKNSNE